MLEEAFVGFLSSYLVLFSPLFFFLDEVRVERDEVVGIEETFVGEEAHDVFFLETIEGEEESYRGDESSTVVVLLPDRFLLSSVVGFPHLDRVEESQVVVLLFPDLVLKSQNRFFESQDRLFESQVRFLESHYRLLESPCLFLVAAVGVVGNTRRSLEETVCGGRAPCLAAEKAVGRPSRAPRFVPYPILGHELAIRSDLFFGEGEEQELVG